MLLFEQEQVQKATHLSRFIDFINEIAPFYKEKIPINIIASYPWDEIQKTLSEFIITGLHKLTDSTGHSSGVVLSKQLKGVYFCLAGDARHFSIHGSLYYNEVDWAANADYDYMDSTELFTLLSDELLSQRLHSKVIQDLLYMFAAFTLLKTLRTIDDINDISNAAMALGYSDGDELTLGYFSNQQFNEYIELVQSYENPSTAPVEVLIPATAPRGDLWNYMRFNFIRFIEAHGLIERFFEFGEVEAERICNEFKGQLRVNRCPLCNALKKTSRARLCLKCGEFTPPVEH